jgi:methyl-accepting chemotaxis protein
MKIRMKIRSKMLLSVIIIASVVFIASIGYLTTKLKTISLKESFNLADAIAGENANLIKASLTNDMGMARTLANSVANFKEIPENKLYDYTKQLLKNVAVLNPEFLSVWCSYELNAVDSKWTKPYGRISLTYFRDNGKLDYSVEYRDQEGDVLESTYYLLKTSKKESLSDPYLYTYPGSNITVLETSACVPLMNGEKFAGLFGFDFELTHYQSQINNFKPFDGSYAMLLSQNSTIVAHTNEKLSGLLFDSIYPVVSKKFDISKKVWAGKTFSATFIDPKSNIEYYATFASFAIEKTDNPWTLALFVPTKVLIQEANAVSNNSFIVILVGLFVLIIVVWIIAYGITNPLVRTTKILGNLAQ